MVKRWPNGEIVEKSRYCGRNVVKRWPNGEERSEGGRGRGRGRFGRGDRNEGPPVKNEVVVGLSLRTGMPAKREALKEIKLSLKATPAGELQNHLGEMIRQERRMETTPGVKTSHLLAVDHLSWASGVVHLAALLLVEDLGERATKRSPAGGVTKMIAGERQNHLVVIRQGRRMETTPGVKASHLLAVDPLSLVSGERAMRMAGIRQKELVVQV